MKFFNSLSLVGLLVLNLTVTGRAPAAGEALQGTISLSPKVKNTAAADEVLFIIARPFGSPNAAPVAVARIVAPKFPQAFTLNSDNLMMEGVPFKGPFLLSAKLSKKGSATTASGDLLGKSASSINEGAQNVKIELKEVAP